MAQVNFDNAVLRPYSNNKPLERSGIMELNNSTVLCNTDGYSICSNALKTVILETANKFSILFVGTFTTSGDKFLLHNYKTWEVSNISFSAGDTYSFVIDIEIDV